MSWVDAVVVVLLAGAAWSGLRRGLINTTITLVGALGGAVVAIKLAPLLMDKVEDTAAKIAIAVAFVVVGVGIGEVAGGIVGKAISERITWTPAKVVDKALGLIGHTAVILVVIWMVAVPLASVPAPWLSAAVRSSAVLGGVDRVMPDGLRGVSDRMRQLLDDSGFPAILSPLTPTPNASVDPPDPAITQLAAVEQAGRSVLKVRGRAPSCAKAIEGTGFVVGPERLLTNAHVVAGTNRVTVEQDGKTLPATVVSYDSNLDVAVLAVPGLTRPALTWADQPAERGQDVVAAGYPLDGPFTLTPGRISDRIQLRGPNIYDSQTVTREVYTIRGAIRSGNSGGPLLSTDGRVLGVVFGAGIDRPDVGFVLTAAAVADQLKKGLADTDPVNTGACTA